MAVISRIEFIGGGWVGGVSGGGGWVKSGRRVKANFRGVVQSVSDPDWHNSQGRPGLPLESVWHPMQSY